MGLFKSMKDMAEITKQGKQIQEQQQREAGYKPGMGGSMAQMGTCSGRRTSSSRSSRGCRRPRPPVGRGHRWRG